MGNWRRTGISSSCHGKVELVLQLVRDSVAQEFLKAKDVELTSAWLEDLLSVGYEPPKLQPRTADFHKLSNVLVQPKRIGENNKPM